MVALGVVGAAVLGMVAALVLRRRGSHAGKAARGELSGAPYPLTEEARPPTGGSNAQVLGPERELALLRKLADWVPAAPGSRAGRALAYVWAAPMSLIGLVAGGTAGVRPTWREGVLLFPDAKGVAGPLLGARGYAAITFGHVVVARVDPGPRLMAHELVHTRQAERLGPLFGPLYLLLYARYGYTRHPLERAARAGGRRAG